MVMLPLPQGSKHFYKCLTVVVVIGLHVFVVWTHDVVHMSCAFSFFFFLQCVLPCIQQPMGSTHARVKFMFEVSSNKRLSTQFVVEVGCNARAENFTLAMQ
jgi:hypothetical protein